MTTAQLMKQERNSYCLAVRQSCISTLIATRFTERKLLVKYHNVTEGGGGGGRLCCIEKNVTFRTSETEQVTREVFLDKVLNDVMPWYFIKMGQPIHTVKKPVIEVSPYIPGIFATTHNKYLSKRNCKYSTKCAILHWISQRAPQLC